MSVFIKLPFTKERNLSLESTKRDDMNTEKPVTMSDTSPECLTLGISG